MSALLIRWSKRRVPLEPAAVVGGRDAAPRLIQRLLAREPEDLGRLEGVATDRTVVVLGDTLDLPWADGVEYLGRDPAAPHLLLPTRLEPNIPVALFAEAIRRQPLGSLVAVVLGPSRLVPLDGALRVTPNALRDWREAHL